MEGIIDVLIVGAGSGGLSAGLFAARSRRSTLILDRKRPGGQAATTERMENYPGFPGCIGGRELMDRFRDHALEMGAKIEKAEVVGFAEEAGIYVVRTRDGGAYRARSLILAPGCEPRRLGIPGERELSGHGVSYCATCDAELFEGGTVVVVGSGETAVEEAIYISRFAEKVIMIVPHDEGVLNCNRSVAEAAFANSKLAWKWNRSPISIEGSDAVAGVRVRNLLSETEETVACDGVFVFIGMLPETAFLGDFVAMKKGFIMTDEKMETNRPLVYAAGDARVKALRQVVTAASDGAIAAYFADRVLTEMDEYAAAVARAGEEFLLYFYTAQVERSLALFPLVERRAGEMGLPLIKLAMFRYGGVAARFGVSEVPRLLHVGRDENGDLVTREELSLEA